MRDSKNRADVGATEGSLLGQMSQHRYVSSWRGQRSEVGGAEDVAQEHHLVGLKAVFCIKWPSRGRRKKRKRSRRNRGRWKGRLGRRKSFGRTKSSWREEEHEN